MRGEWSRCIIISLGLFQENVISDTFLEWREALKPKRNLFKNISRYHHNANDRFGIIKTLLKGTCEDGDV